MKKYKVIATMTIKLETIIEANSEEEANEIAREIEGDSFKEISNSGTWSIDSVYEEN